MYEKSLLNNGFGSPGETTRTLTIEFIKLKRNHSYNNSEAFHRILIARSLIYQNMGLDILGEKLIEKVVEKSRGELPFVILADILITNKAQGLAHVFALMKNYDLVVEVVVENYNSLVNSEERLTAGKTISLSYRFKDFAKEVMNDNYKEHFNDKKETRKQSPAVEKDGSSIETAIIINSTSSIFGVQAEYKYIIDKYGQINIGWVLESQGSLHQGERNYDRLDIKLKNGESLSYYFDITQFHGKF